MALSVQDDSGTVADATSYLSVTDFKTYHSTRGNSLGTHTDGDIEKALTKGTDYLDCRFTYVGRKCQGLDQSTEWPRYGAVNQYKEAILGIPLAVKEALAEYALRALSGDLLPDPDVEVGAEVVSKSTQVGPISESVTYAESGAQSLPSYPLADNKLLRAGLVRGNRTLTARRA